jgi:hypothetical protein
MASRRARATRRRRTQEGQPMSDELLQSAKSCGASP